MPKFSHVGSRRVIDDEFPHWRIYSAISSLSFLIISSLGIADDSDDIISKITAFDVIKFVFVII